MPQYFAMRGTVSRAEVRAVPSGINELGPRVNASQPLRICSAF